MTQIRKPDKVQNPNTKKLISNLPKKDDLNDVIKTNLLSLQGQISFRYFRKLFAKPDIDYKGKSEWCFKILFNYILP